MHMFKLALVLRISDKALNILVYLEWQTEIKKGEVNDSLHLFI